MLGTTTVRPSGRTCWPIARGRPARGGRWVSHIVPKSAKSVNERQQDCEETLEVAEEGVVAAFEADGGFGAVAREDTDVVVQVKDAALH